MNKITKLRHWIDDTAKINRIKLGKPFQALLCLKDNNKSIGSFNFYEKSQHSDRLVFAVEMFFRWHANRILGFLANFLFVNYVQQDVFTLISSYSAFIRLPCHSASLLAASWIEYGIISNEFLNSEDNF